MVQKERRWTKEITHCLLELISSSPTEKNYAEIAHKINNKFSANFSPEDINFRFTRLKHEYKNFKKTEGFSKKKQWVYWDHFLKIDAEKLKKKKSNSYDFRGKIIFLSKKFEEIENFFSEKT